MSNGMRAKLGARFGLTVAMLVALAMPAAAKVQVDFNPELNFAQYKTFAYIGGTNQLVMMQLNPDLISDRVHRAVTREMTAKGLKEVNPNQNPDLVVRYWATSSKDADVSSYVTMGIYQPFIGSYWGFWYDTISVTTQRQATLLVDLIDPKKKDLVWRIYVIEKIINTDKAWKSADQDFAKGFESFPPSAKEIEDKKKERLEHPPKPDSGQ